MDKTKYTIRPMRRKRKTLDDLYTGVKKSALSEDTKKRVLDLLEHYLSE